MTSSLKTRSVYCKGALSAFSIDERQIINLLTVGGNICPYMYTLCPPLDMQHIISMLYLITKSVLIKYAVSKFTKWWRCYLPSSIHVVSKYVGQKEDGR